MKFLVLSDLHLGRGRYLRSGQVNILEDFIEDERFKEFAQYHSSGEFAQEEVHLFLNGDILNLIQIDIDGVFSHIIDEERTIKALEIIALGHPDFFKGLKDFLSNQGNKLTYVIGNHDAPMAFPGVQKRFCEIVGAHVEFCFNYQEHGIHIEHGHRFEMINTVPPSKYFMDGPNGKLILNLPWGSLFCINVLPRLKKLRPLLDRVRPMSAYVSWCLLHDFTFFWTMAVTIIVYFIKTNRGEYTKQNRNIKTTATVLKQITMYPRYYAQARRILSRYSELHTIIMGHTHVLEWRRYPEGKFYFNTGTWNSIPSMDAGLTESITKLTYVLMDVDTHNHIVRHASLNEWQGTWKPYRSQVSSTY